MLISNALKVQIPFITSGQAYAVDYVLSGIY